MGLQDRFPPKNTVSVAGWTINPAAKAAEAKAFNSTYQESTTLESVGIPSGPYGAIVKPMLTDLSENALLLKQIIETNQLNNRTVDHAIEFPGTLLATTVSSSVWLSDCNLSVSLNRVSTA